MIDETQTKLSDTSDKIITQIGWNLENLHPEIAMKKEKIFSKSDFSKRKTKIICTLG